MPSRFLRGLLPFVFLAAAHAAPASASEASFSFATAGQGREILTTRDDYVQRLSPFDRAARLKTDQDVSEETYLRFVGAQTLDWADAEKTLMQSVIAELRPALESLDLPWPESILLVKTTGREEANAAYTRANAIMLPQAEVDKGKTSLKVYVAHELFHVLSRQNPALKEKIYAAIGFKPCGEVALPPSLAAVKITNPDAPKNDHCIRVAVDGHDVWAMPLIYSGAPKYDPVRGGEFFDYLQFGLLVVGEGAEPPVAAAVDEAHVRLVDVARVSGFFEQAGRNTGYIIHPEEILADNFSLLLRGQRNVESPEIVEKIRNVLTLNPP
jgi:hypothetical protein